MVWEKLAKKYDRLWVQRVSLGPTRQQVLRRIAGVGAESLIDLGCGTGQLLHELSVRHPEMRLAGIDKAPAMIGQCGEKRIPAEFYCRELPCDSLALEGFDAAVCCHSFPYYRDKPGARAQIHGLLRSDGTAIFVQASGNNLYDRIALWFTEKTAEKAEYLSHREFAALVEGRFAITERFTIRERWFMPSICGFVMKKI